MTFRLKVTKTNGREEYATIVEDFYDKKQKALPQKHLNPMVIWSKLEN